jgi:hypothetical protein
MLPAIWLDAAGIAWHARTPPEDGWWNQAVLELPLAATPIGM